MKHVNAELSAAVDAVHDLLGTGGGGRVIFTKSGSESCAAALNGAVFASPEKDVVITTEVEHNSVIRTCDELERLGKRVIRIGVDIAGLIDIEQLRAALTKNTSVVSVMMANHETGIVFPINEIGRTVKEYSDALFHVDGSAAAGTITIELRDSPVDLFSMSGRKIGGPDGIGALFITEGVTIGAGSSVTDRTSLAEFSNAAAAAAKIPPKAAVTAKLRDRMESEILRKIPNSRLNGTSETGLRLPNASSISFENTNGEMILSHLSDSVSIEYFRTATGCACADPERKPSSVLRAMGVPYQWAMGSVHISILSNANEEHVERFVKNLCGAVARVRSHG